MLLLNFTIFINSFTPAIALAANEVEAWKHPQALHSPCGDYIKFDGENNETKFKFPEDWKSLWSNQGVRNEGWATFLYFLVGLDRSKSDTTSFAGKINEAIRMSPHKLESSLGLAAWLVLYLEHYSMLGWPAISLEIDRKFITTTASDILNQNESDIQFLARVFPGQDIEIQKLTPDELNKGEISNLVES